MERRSRFIKPETETLPISDGDTITVRKKLNNGERRAMFARMYDTGVTPLRVNTLETGIAVVVAYLVDWSLVDDAGEKIEIAGIPGDELADLLDNLEPESFTEIKDAIENYIESQESEKKMTTIGERESSPTLPSVA